jgi:hypothetical protein
MEKNGKTAQTRDTAHAKEDYGSNEKDNLIPVGALKRPICNDNKVLKTLDCEDFGNSVNGFYVKSNKKYLLFVYDSLSY